MTGHCVRRVVRRVMGLTLIGLAASPGQALATDPGERDCAATPTLVMEQPFDFGHHRLQPGEDGYVTVTPQGEVLASDSVMVRVDPVPARLRVCGPAHAHVAIGIESLERQLSGDQGPPAAEKFSEIDAAGYGFDLERLGPGLWRGQLNETGTAELRLGGTLTLRSQGRHGRAFSDVRILIDLDD